MKIEVGLIGGKVFEADVYNHPDFKDMSNDEVRAAVDEIVETFTDSRLQGNGRLELEDGSTVRFSLPAVYVRVIP